MANYGPRVEESSRTDQWGFSMNKWPTSAFVLEVANARKREQLKRAGGLIYDKIKAKIWHKTMEIITERAFTLAKFGVESVDELPKSKRQQKIERPVEETLAAKRAKEDAVFDLE